MDVQTIEIKTKDGLAPCQFFAPPGSDKRPAVIVYMDAFGIRQALSEMARRLASYGYWVLLPDLYYRSGAMAPFDPAKAFADEKERDRLTPLYKSLNHRIVMDDTSSFLDFLAGHAPTAGKKVGCVGYCMGGGFALTAAGTFPDRVHAAASFHGARLATDQPDSPHLLAPKMRGEVYVGTAGIDPHFTPEEKQRLETALQAGACEGDGRGLSGRKTWFCGD